MHDTSPQLVLHDSRRGAIRCSRTSLSNNRIGLLNPAARSSSGLFNTATANASAIRRPAPGHTSPTAPTCIALAIQHGKGAAAVRAFSQLVVVAQARSSASIEYERGLGALSWLPLSKKCGRLDMPRQANGLDYQTLAAREEQVSETGEKALFRSRQPPTSPPESSGDFADASACTGWARGGAAGVRCLAGAIDPKRGSLLRNRAFDVFQVEWFTESIASCRMTAFGQHCLEAFRVLWGLRPQHPLLRFFTAANLAGR